VHVNASFITILWLGGYANFAGWVTDTNYRLHSSFAITLDYTLASHRFMKYGMAHGGAPGILQYTPRPVEWQILSIPTASLA